jgi:ligand-binding sensor domain-containing protein
VQCLYADKDQNIWLGTYGEGIMMLNHSPQRFLQFQKKSQHKIPKAGFATTA